MAVADACASPPGDLWAVLAQVNGPRARRGVRYRLETVLAVCAVLAGARSFVAVAEWAADLDPAMRAEVGLVGPVPSESTFRRVLQKLDADRFDALLGAGAERRTRPQGGLRRHLAVDGKTVRGSSGSDGPARHLLAALDHDHGVVLAQVGVAATTGEAAQLPVLLAGLDLTDVVITADAAHTQQAAAGGLHARGTHYMLTGKRNQPKLFAQLTALPTGRCRSGTAPGTMRTARSRPAP